jgi:hypothetical protein
VLDVHAQDGLSVVGGEIKLFRTVAVEALVGGGHAVGVPEPIPGGIVATAVVEHLLVFHQLVESRLEFGLLEPLERGGILHDGGAVGRPGECGQQR